MKRQKGKTPLVTAVVQLMRAWDNRTNVDEDELREFATRFAAWLSAGLENEALKPSELGADDVSLTATGIPQVIADML